MFASKTNEREGLPLFMCEVCWDDCYQIAEPPKDELVVLSGAIVVGHCCANTFDCCIS